MARKPIKRVKIFRRGELIDPHSTQIRREQAEKLRKLAAKKTRAAKDTSAIKLISREPEQIYTSGGVLLTCRACAGTNPTKSMYRFRSSSHGSVVLCEKCVVGAEYRSFCNLDALDFPRKKVKVK